MKSGGLGQRTFQVEVTNVSPHGFWILIGEQELFAPFKEFPWFKDASIGEITRVELPSPYHLYWPDLDVDLAVESLSHPERYPLVSQAKPDKRLQPKARQRTGRKQSTRPRTRG
jgi:hypothetical protein